MAQTHTAHVFDIAFSHVDRNVYDTLSLRVSRHPSESEEHLVTRVLAYGLELEEGLTFTQGLSVAEEPALWVRDLTGQLRAWIEVGTPSPERLHKATKACERVSVYCHKAMPVYLRTLAAARVFAPERIAIFAMDRTFVNEIATRLEKRTKLAFTVADGTMYVEIAGHAVSAPLERLAYPA